jgi:hypothetical protein
VIVQRSGIAVKRFISFGGFFLNTMGVLVSNRAWPLQNAVLKDAQTFGHIKELSTVNEYTDQNARNILANIAGTRTGFVVQRIVERFRTINASVAGGKDNVTGIA